MTEKCILEKILKICLPQGSNDNDFQIHFFTWTHECGTYNVKRRKETIILYLKSSK